MKDRALERIELIFRAKCHAKESRNFLPGGFVLTSRGVEGGEGPAREWAMALTEYVAPQHSARRTTLAASPPASSLLSSSPRVGPVSIPSPVSSLTRTHQIVNPISTMKNYK